MRRQPVFRLDVVVLPQRPADLVLRHRSAARSKTARFWRNWASVSDMAWTVAARQAGASAASSSASTVSCSRRPPTRWQVLAPYIWLAPSAPVGGAAAGVVADLHAAVRTGRSAEQQALQRQALLFSARRAGPLAMHTMAGSWRPAWRCWRRRFPGDVAGTVAGDHHRPLVTRKPPLAGDHGPMRLLSMCFSGLAAPVGEHPGIAGMDQDVVHGRVAGLRPHDLPGADVPPGQPQAVSAEADDHLPGRAEPVKPAEHARDRLACRLIRGDDHVVTVVVVQPGGQRQPQLTAGGLGAQSLGHP